MEARVVHGGGILSWAGLLRGNFRLHCSIRKNDVTRGTFQKNITGTPFRSICLHSGYLRNQLFFPNGGSGGEILPIADHKRSEASQGEECGQEERGGSSVVTYSKLN